MKSLEVRNLKIGYRDSPRRVDVVHEGLNFELRSGEVTCLLGINGAGKSTLLRTLCGFQPPLGGQIELLGRPLSSYNEAERSKLIGVVLTERGAGGGLTAYEMTSLGRHPHTGFFGELKSHDHQVIRESLEAVGIAHKAGSYISQLSDGERQKVMIAKALAQQCPIIILDEPTAFLDVASRIDVMVLLRDLASRHGKTILLSSHDLDMAIQMADSLWLQKKGAPLACGTPEELIMSGTLAAFLDREGVVFDEQLGRLTIPASSRMVQLVGDKRTTLWVGNALTRWGFNPAGGAGDMTINCHSISDLDLGDKYHLTLQELRAELLG